MTESKRIEAGVLHVAYEEAGDRHGRPVILLHGFPYDVRAFDDVAVRLVSSGCRVITPYLRGYGPTRFLSADTPRSGQQAVLAQDLLSLMDALDIPSATLAGYDWGGRAACIVAALWPQRVDGLVTGSGQTCLHQRMMTEEDEFGPRAQEAVRLGDPDVGITPDRGAVLAEGEVERRIRLGDLLGIPVDPLDVVHAVVGGQPARRRQLPRRVVDGVDGCTAPAHPGRPVAGPTPEIRRWSSSSDPNAPDSSRSATIRAAKAGPIRGRRTSSAADARFRSMLSPGSSGRASRAASAATLRGLNAPRQPPRTLSTPPKTSSALQGLATRSLFVVFVVHRRWRRSNSRLLELLLLRIRGGVQRLLLDRRLGDRRPLGLIRFYQVYAR